MPTSPGVHIDETQGAWSPIAGVATAVAAFVGRARKGPVGTPVRIRSYRDFEDAFGRAAHAVEPGFAVRQFFLNGGGEAWMLRVVAGRHRAPPDPAAFLAGLEALAAVRPLNILCLPEVPRMGRADQRRVYAAALDRAESARAMLIADIPEDVDTPERVEGWVSEVLTTKHRDVAVYFPRLAAPDGGGRGPSSLPASGSMAGIWARIDAKRGVWKAPAGLEAVLKGVDGLACELGSAELDRVNASSVNALRRHPAGPLVVWGARTLDPTEEWRYLPVRRTALYIEESLEHGLQWAVFEPNDEDLWLKLTRQVDAFMSRLFQQGAFQGATKEEAWFVKCDAETNTVEDRLLGRIVMLVGFAALKPEEFVILRVALSAARFD